MENTVTLLVEIGLQRDVEGGDVAGVVVEMTKWNAAKVIQGQENCELLNEGGALFNLINAYALLNGYQRGWFVRAALIDQKGEKADE